jgi:tRNA-binding protein
MQPDAQTYCTRLKVLIGNDDPLTVLAATPGAITAAITGVDAAALAQRPSPGKWSVGEIVAHLADSELVFGYRLRIMLTVNDVALQAFDPDRFAATFNYAAADIHTSAELFAAARMGNLRMLRIVPNSLLDNTGRHEEWGRESVRSVIALEAGHDRNHLAQIHQILEGAGGRAPFTPAAQKPEIAIPVAAQVDLRVGTISSIEEVAGSDRLMKLSVDFGSERRTVIAAVRQERSDPGSIVGKQALFYYNLQPKTIRGQVSEAMLCDAGYADGVLPALLEPERPVPNGTRAG